MKIDKNLEENLKKGTGILSLEDLIIEETLVKKYVSKLLEKQYDKIRKKLCKK